jgi:hypothetical protein
MKKYFPLLLLIFIRISHAWAFSPVMIHQQYTAWYVDSVNGNDSNSCQNQGNACASIHNLFDNALCTAVETPYECCGGSGIGTCTGTGKTHPVGERILLASNSTWNEGLILPSSGMRAIGYGNGSLPLLDCSNTIPTSAWSLTTGTTYQASLTHPYSNSQGWTLVYENNINLIKKTSLSTCESTAGSYYVSSDTATSFTLYVNTTGGTNPATDGNTYQYSYRSTGIAAVTNSVEIQGIHTRRSWNLGESLRVLERSLIANCLVEDGSRHNIYSEDGCALVNVTAHNQYYASGGCNLFDSYENIPPQYGILYYNCTAYADSFSGLNGNNGGSQAFQVEANAAFGPVTYINPIVTNQNIAMGGSAGSSSFSIINPNFTNICGVSYTGGSLTMTGGSVSTTSTNASNFISSYTGFTTTVSNMTLTFNKQGTSGLFINSGGNLILTGSIINYNTTTANYTFYAVGSNTGTIQSTSNNFSTTNGGHGSDMYYITNTNVTLASNNNCFNSTFALYNNYHGTAYTGLTNWQGAGFDLNSQSSSSCL